MLPSPAFAALIRTPVVDLHLRTLLQHLHEQPNMTLAERTHMVCETLSATSVSNVLLLELLYRRLDSPEFDDNFEAYFKWFGPNPGFSYHFFESDSNRANVRRLKAQLNTYVQVVHSLIQDTLPIPDLTDIVLGYWGLGIDPPCHSPVVRTRTKPACPRWLVWTRARCSVPFPNY